MKKLIFILFAFTAGVLHAVDIPWIHLTGYPWPAADVSTTDPIYQNPPNPYNGTRYKSYAADMVEFNSEYYVGITTKPINPIDNAIRLYKTADFTTWQTVPITVSNDAVIAVQHLIEHEGMLFAFCKINPSASYPNGWRQVYRSANGSNWERVDSLVYVSTAEWSGIASFNGYIYVGGVNAGGSSTFGTQGDLFRTPGIGPNPAWERPAQLQGTSRPSLIVYHDELYVAVYRGQTLGIDVYKSADGQSWYRFPSTEPTQPPNTFFRKNGPAGASPVDKYNFAIYRDELYFGYEVLVKLTSAGWLVPADINWNTSDFIPFVVHGLIHIKKSNSAAGIFRYKASGGPHFGSPFMDATYKDVVGLNHVPIVRRGHDQFVLLGDIFKAPADGVGVIGFAKEAFVSPSLVAGSQGNTVHSWSYGVDVEDSLTELTIKNNGTAEAGLEIERVSLYYDNEFKGDLVPDGDLKTWRTPPTFTPVLMLAELRRSFEIRIDISSSARENKTVQFIIPTSGMTYAISAYQVSAQSVGTSPLLIEVDGVSDVNATTNISAVPLDQGVKNAPLLGWEVDFNAGTGEKIKGVRTVNLGNAEAGTDITAIRIAQKSFGLSLQYLTDLIPGSDLKTWTTPPAWPGVDIKPGDQFFLLADISPTSRATRSVHFAIPRDGFTWNVNTDYVMANDLISPLMQAITAPGSIPEAVVFPNPATDHATFTYDLPSDANVEINLFDTTGALVSEIREFKTAGVGAQTVWEAAKMAPGVYFAVLKIHAVTGEDRVYKRKVYIKK